MDSHYNFFQIKDEIVDEKNHVTKVHWFFYKRYVLLEKGTFEVFKYAVGAQFDEDNIAISDGELHSYKTFKSLKCALTFALNIKKTGIFPKPEMVY